MNTLSMCRVIGVVVLLIGLVVGRAPAQAPEMIVVNNALDRSVLVWVDGIPVELVDAGEEKAIGNAPEGVVTLMATDAATGALIATEHTSLSEGETFTWTLYLVRVAGEEMGTGTMVLTNGLDSVIEIRLGGETRAVLAPGATRVLSQVVAGVVEAAAATPDGTTVDTEMLTIIDGEITRWVVGG